MFFSPWKWIRRNRIWIGRGAVLGSVYILVVIGFLLLMRAWLEIPFGDSFFAMGQLVADLILLPVAIVGFLFAAHQFRITAQEFQKAQAKPSADLFWSNNTKELLLEQPSRGGGIQVIRFVLINTGTRIATWYAVTISVPRSLGVGKESLQTTVGSFDASGDGRWTSQIEEPFMRYSYRSDGKAAIYLEEPLQLVGIYITMSSQKAYNEWYELPYTIANDWGEPVRGKLRLHVVQKHA